MAFDALGKDVRGPSRNLETFAAPAGITHVTLDCDEVASLCPVTTQPDLYTVMIEYVPDTRCIETKSLKRYLWTFRDQGIFCETLAAQICNDLTKALQPKTISVTATQKRRGGIQITSKAHVPCTPRLSAVSTATNDSRG
jgi:7-cyano-7-deazaguanine reductase